jgi:hypothetical protein
VNHVDNVVADRAADKIADGNRLICLPRSQTWNPSDGSDVGGPSASMSPPLRIHPRDLLRFTGS